MPTLYVGGKAIRPAKAQVYYVLRGYGEMHPFPAGLKMVAGDAHAVRPQPSRVTYWSCGASAVRRSFQPTRAVYGVFVKFSLP